MPTIPRSFHVKLMGIIALLCLAAQVCAAQTRVADRIVQPVDASRTIALRGNMHPMARPEFDQGEVDSAMVLPRMTLFFKPTADQQADLDSLLAQLQDRSSPNYHRWLTPEQFGERFGVSASDLAKVTAWLQSQGFNVVETARGRNWVTFSGTARQVSAALRTSIHRYAVNGETHYANAAEPFVPAAFADIVGGFRGLNDFRLNARGVRASAPSVQPKFTSAVSGRHFVTPGDFATIYDVNTLYSNGIDGTGQKIAVMGQTDIDLNDTRAFRAAAGLPAKDPTVMLVGGTDPGTSSADILEANLDVEWAGAVAKNATIIYVNSTNVIGSMQSAINQNLAPVVSISYGNCEAQFGSPGGINAIAALAQQANAQGITIVAPAGDNGATDCDATAPATHGLAVDLPAAFPYVTGIGGTQFNEGSGTYWQAASGSDVVSSALSYIPEIVWNQTPASGTTSATGGGASSIFSKPVWQTGAGVPSDSARDVPDVSFNAAPDPDGYLICAQGSCTSGFRNGAGGSLNEIGGTSAGVPTFAGVVALINQQTQSTGQGNINYILYALAASSPAAFHDVTSGNNKTACTSGSTDCPSGTATIGYVATAGYDQTTGLGSPDVNNLVTQWTSVSATSLSESNSGSTADFQLALSPSSLTVVHGNTATSQITVKAFNGFSATPTFTCNVGTALAGVTCQVVAGTLEVIASASAAADSSRRIGSLPFAIAIAALLILFTETKHGINGLGGSRISKVCQPKLAPTLVLASALLIAVGCGGGSSSSGNSNGNGSNGTVASGSVAVTATSGSISHTAQISVTVN
jgi:subtilase family serine protease